MRVSCRSFLGVTLGLWALLVPASAWAADPISEYNAVKHASLKGLASLEVIVPPARMDAGCRPFPPNDLQTEIEDRLAQGGIRVEPGTATYLIVTLVSIEPLKDLVCAFTVTVGLQQAVLLVRDANVMTFGMTWEHAGLGVTAPAQVPERMRYMLAHIVDEFIAVYREQNPKP